MIYVTDKSRNNLHLNTLLEIMAEISIKCILVKERKQTSPAKETTRHLLLLKGKMVEAFDNLFDSREISDNSIRILFRVVMTKSDDIQEVITLLNFRDSI